MNAVHLRQQPCLQRGQQRSVIHCGPCLFRQPLRRTVQPQAQLLSLWRPVEHPEAFLTNTVEHRLMQLCLRGLRQRLGLDHQLADHRPPPGFQRPLRFIPLHRVGTFRQFRAGGDQLADFHWQSQQHAGIRRSATLQQQRSDKPFMTAQRVVGVQHRAHAVRQLVAPLLTAAAGDAIGEGRRQQPRH